MLFRHGVTEERSEWLIAQNAVASLRRNHVLLLKGKTYDYLCFTCVCWFDLVTVLALNLYCKIISPGFARIYVCKSGGSWHAWDYLGRAPGHYPGKNLWWERTEESVLRIPSDNATGEVKWPILISVNLHSRFARLSPVWHFTWKCDVCLLRQGFMCLQSGICLSSMGRPVSYDRAVAWKVLNEEENAHCICFMFINWSFVWKFSLSKGLDFAALIFLLFCFPPFWEKGRSHYFVQLSSACILLFTEYH